MNSHPLPPLDTADALVWLAIYIGENTMSETIANTETRDDFACVVADLIDEAARVLNVELPPVMGDEQGAVTERVWDTLVDAVNFGEGLPEDDA